MTQKPPNTGRFRPARDRWTRLTMAAVGAMVAGSLIARRAVHSPDQAGNATADPDTPGSAERGTPGGQALAQGVAERLRSASTAAAGRLSAAGRAAWRELLHPGHDTRTGPDAAAPSARPPENTPT
jgi:hypothetical protein